MNFYKFQKILSVIPYYSTAFISVVTMAKLTTYRAPQKYWGQYIGMFFLSNITLFILNDLVLDRLNSVLNVIVCGALLVPLNFLFVDLQEKAEKREKNGEK